ncbi:hypothetical protein ACIBU0_19380 [Streptomyces sp. NPDC049627]|uniref:hypothetical protein n=1 Tax=Streptomyces sp. NPDC049627 TaxID=3365595 RepID=UPI0037B0D3D0
MLLGAMSGTSFAWTMPMYLCEGSEKDAGGVDCAVRFYTDNSYLVDAGVASFYAYDEILTAWDQEKDGLGVYVKASWTSGGTSHSREVAAVNGSGDVDSANLDIPEGTKVTVKACQRQSGEIHNCLTVTATA